MSTPSSFAWRGHLQDRCEPKVLIFVLKSAACSDLAGIGSAILNFMISELGLTQINYGQRLPIKLLRGRPFGRSWVVGELFH